MLDGAEFGNEIVVLVRGYLDREVAPLKAENAELKERLKALEDRPAPEIDIALVERMLEAEIAKLPAPGPAKEVDMEQVASLIREAVAALPPPQDGESVTVDDITPLIISEIGKAVAALPRPRSIVGVVVNRDGEAVHTFSDGTTENIGRVVGTDGRDVDMQAVELRLREMVDAIPKPKDGRDGIDLSSFDAIVLEDDRTIEFKFVSGEEERVASFKWPTILDRGVYKAGETYDAGDAVTWGGSLWIAQRQTDAKPDTPDSGFRLAVKRGRDGKDAKVG